MASEAGFVATPEEEQAKETIGARLILNTPIDGLDLRVSGWTGSLNIPGEPSNRVWVAGFSLNYVTQRLHLRAEWFREQEGSDFETNTTAYVEAAVYVTSHIQVAARYDWLQTKLPEFDGPAAFLRHRDIAFGLNYWVNPSAVFKASFHVVDGYRFVLPEVASTLPTTYYFDVGTQFSF